MKLQEDVLIFFRNYPERATPQDVLALLEEIERIKDLKGIRSVRVTHCKQGHEFTPENTYHTARGGRRCKACTRKYQKEYQDKHPDKYERVLEANRAYRERRKERQRQ